MDAPGETGACVLRQCSLLLLLLLLLLLHSWPLQALGVRSTVANTSLGHRPFALWL
jgi:hypothetical protein